MTAQQNKEIIREFNDTLHKGGPKTDELLSQFSIDQELKRHVEVFETAFPAYILDREDLIAEGDKVVMSFTFRGIYKNEIFGIPPKNQQVSVPGIIIYWLEDGKIIRHNLKFDTLSMMEQIGAFQSHDAMASYAQAHA